MARLKTIQNVFKETKKLLKNENLKYLKRLNISSQPRTSDFN